MPLLYIGTSASTAYTITARVSIAYIVICDAATTTKNNLYLNNIQGQPTSISVTYPSSSITLERGKPITFTWTNTGIPHSSFNVMTQ